MATDRPGLASRVLAEVASRGWETGIVWAETRAGMFFLVTELNRGRRNRPAEGQLTELRERLQSQLEADVRILHAEAEFLPDDEPFDCQADVVIEGKRRSKALAHAASALAKDEASITSIRTDFVEGSFYKYVVRAMFGAAAREGLEVSLHEVSDEEGLEFELIKD